MQLRMLVVAAVGLMLAADGKDDAQKQMKELQGTWKATSIEFSGEKVLGDSVRDLQLVIKGNHMTVEGDFPDSEKYGKLTLKIDPTTKPKLMDVTITGGDDKGTVVEAVYEVTKDELKICANPFAKDRPTEFSSKPNSSTVLAVFRRGK
jgi:uncharacterized protein (TIGR03067 family)